jgi:hypothetical protein
MATEPKRPEPDIPPQKPDVQPEPRPQEIPPDIDVPEKEAPLKMLERLASSQLPSTPTFPHGQLAASWLRWSGGVR